MKKLQNNFTTKEQSERLLKIGVPADSADCFYDLQFFGGQIVQTRMWIGWRISKTLFTGALSDIIIPCWSVGRLMEIFDICALFDTTEEYPQTGEMIAAAGSVTEYLVKTFEIAKIQYKLDISKLED